MKSILIILMISFSSLLYAEGDSLKYYEKGKTLCYAQLAYSPAYSPGSITGNIRYGKNFIPGLYVGGDLGFTSNGLYYNKVFFKPLVRYYFLKRNISPFVEAGYSLGVFNSNNGEARYIQMNEVRIKNLSRQYLNGIEYKISFDIGISMQSVYKRLGIEVFYSYKNLTIHPVNYSQYYMGIRKYNYWNSSINLRLSYKIK